jgi:hypothetical protein
VLSERYFAPEVGLVKEFNVGGPEESLELVAIAEG